MQQYGMFPPLYNAYYNALAPAIVAKSIKKLNANYSVIPANTVSIDGFKTYNNFIALADISQDTRITQILLSILTYIENKSELSIFTTQWKAAFTISYWANFEIAKKNIANIEIIEYKGQNYFETDILSIVDPVFTLNNIVLPTYNIIENGNRDPLIKLNPNYQYPSFTTTEDNVFITFNTENFVFPPDLQQAVYVHALNVYNGFCPASNMWANVPPFSQDIYNTYFFQSGTSKASGLMVL